MQHGPRRAGTTLRYFLTSLGERITEGRYRSPTPSTVPAYITVGVVQRMRKIGRGLSLRLWNCRATVEGGTNTGRADDENNWGLTCETNIDYLHPAEAARRASQDRAASDKRRDFAYMIKRATARVGDYEVGTSARKAGHAKQD